MATHRWHADDPARDLFVRGCPPGWGDRDLYLAAQQYGPVLKARMILDPDGTSRCYGFVRMATPEASRKARAGLAGKLVSGAYTLGAVPVKGTAEPVPLRHNVNQQKGSSHG